MVTVPFGRGRSTGTVGTLSGHEATECHPVDEVSADHRLCGSGPAASRAAGQSGVLSRDAAYEPGMARWNPQSSAECTKCEHSALYDYRFDEVASLQSMTRTVDPPSERQVWLRELSCAPAAELELLARKPLERYGADVLELRRPEVGLTLVTGRVGGTGEAFGVGEMTVTRCVVQVGGDMGVGYVRGRGTARARTIAVLDALLQGQHADELKSEVLRPLAESRLERAGQHSAQTEATRVQFLTMVRGN